MTKQADREEITKREGKASFVHTFISRQLSRYVPTTRLMKVKDSPVSYGPV